MKIPELKTQIINRYIQLNELARIKPQDNGTVPMWHLDMENWHADQVLHNVYYKKGIVDVYVKENDVVVKHKPFFLSNKWALRKANKALKEFIDNFNNYDVVLKSKAPVRVYTPEAIATLRKAAKVVK